MFCNKCGNKLKNNEIFCGKCGSKVMSEGNTQSKIKINKKFLMILIDVIILIVVLVTMRNILGIGTGNYKNIVDNYCKSIDSKINYDYDVTISGDTVYVTVRAKDKYTADMYGTSKIFTINKSSKQIVSAPFEKIEY